MILEGIVTTRAADGSTNIAPMGPYVDLDMRAFVLRPYRSTQTYRNLKEHGEGVFHVTDDVWLLAQAAVGQLTPLPSLLPASSVRGCILQDACRYYEFRVRSLDDLQDRTRIEVQVVHAGRFRDFFGFNRAKHAVLEAAILATRTDFLPLHEIDVEYRRLAVLVDKTGGDQERQAFAFLERFLAGVKRANLAAEQTSP